MKKIFIIIVLAIFISGCATLNSIPQYTQSYTQDVDNIWSAVKKLPLKNNYSYSISFSKDKIYQNIPFIKNNNVYLSKAFIDYVYKYHYNNRYEILTCLFLHEISHSEFNLSDKPVETHYLVDKKAFEYLLLPNFPNDANYKTNQFYSFLRVLQNFNEAEKGIAKHCFNIAWNTVNAATLLYAGVGSFGDWFTYDISTRVYWFYGEHIQAKPKFVYKRSQFPRKN